MMSRERWSEVERLYHAAASREVTDRAAFLADACAGDDACEKRLNRCSPRKRAPRAS